MRVGLAAGCIRRCRYRACCRHCPAGVTLAMMNAAANSLDTMRVRTFALVFAQLSAGVHATGPKPPHLHRNCGQGRCHICARTGLGPCQICTRTGWWRQQRRRRGRACTAPPVGCNARHVPQNPSLAQQCILRCSAHATRAWLSDSSRSISIRQAAPVGHPVLAARHGCGAGAFFGELDILLDHSSLSFSAVATEPTELFVLTKSTLLKRFSPGSSSPRHAVQCPLQHPCSTPCSHPVHGGPQRPVAVWR